MASPKTPATFHLVIRNRQEVMLDDQVSAVTSVNGKGRFDVLPNHANFISLIERYVIIHRPNKPDETMKITGGLIQVELGETKIYLD